MKVTKKDQIIQLYKEGLGIDDIIKKGFTKKYVNQVLKDLKTTDSVSLHSNNFTISDVKELASILEMLQNKSDKINININIEIKVDSHNATSNNTNTPLLNPVTVFRDIGMDGLKGQLMLLQLEDLIKIVKAYTPDLDGKMYKNKNKDVVIDYIIERASKLSKLGQVFRDVSNPK